MVTYEDRRAVDRVVVATQSTVAAEALPDVRDGGRRTYLAGEYTEWSSIQGAIKSGREAAAAVLEDL